MPNIPLSAKSTGTVSGTPQFFTPWKSADPGTFLNLSTSIPSKALAIGSIGTHDFASFAANRGQAPETTIRTIRHIGIQRRKELLIMEFDGNGFLYRMVRMLTGTIVRVASRRADLNWIAELLASPGKTKTNCTAPAAGLYLVKVKYQ